MSSSSQKVTLLRNANDFVLPGQLIARLSHGAAAVLGRGVASLDACDAMERGASSAHVGQEERGDSVLVRATVAGVVNLAMVADPSSGNSGATVPKFDVISPTAKRYMPRLGDSVVGIVVKAASHSYQVHINGPHLAVLDCLAFDGATKSNRPKLVPGDVVYCHISAAQRDIDVEVSCESRDGNAKDWVTGEGQYGQLKEGAVVALPVQAFSPSSAPHMTRALDIMGARAPFDAALGSNGRMWLRPLMGKASLGGDSASGTTRGPVSAATATTRILIALHRCLHEAAALISDGAWMEGADESSPTTASSSERLHTALSQCVERYFPSTQPN